MKTDNEAPPAPCSPPPATGTGKGKVVINLTLRIFTLIFLFIALIVLVTNNVPVVVSGVVIHFRFDMLKPYQYMLAAIVIGFVYSLVQSGFALYPIVMKKLVATGSGLLLFNFYGDKVLSYLLATEAAAGLSITVDNMQQGGTGTSLDEIVAKGSASSSMVLLAFLLAVVSSIMSSYALPKKSP